MGLRIMKFIVVGPIDNFYHVCYQLAGTTVYSSVCLCRTPQGAALEAELLSKDEDAWIGEGEVITVTPSRK